MGLLPVTGCETCGRELPAGRGRPRKFCPDRPCKSLSRRRSAGACTVCGSPLPDGKGGRFLCGVAQCADQSREDTAERYELSWSELLARFERVSGALEDGAVYRRDRPPKKADRAKNGRLTGAVDADPFDYLPHDVAAEFVREFGRTGAEVGQTYPNAGLTLG